jgi:hypothetical protein
LNLTTSIPVALIPSSTVQYLRQLAKSLYNNR